MNLEMSKWNMLRTRKKPAHVSSEKMCKREIINKTTEKMARRSFPPEGYVPSTINTLCANALDLSAPASDALLKNRKNAWVQLAGHPDSFAPAGPNTIWKKRLLKENYETDAYVELMDDCIRPLIPQFYREVVYNTDIFIEIEDLLQHFTDPSIMDVKMGTRTFLEAEVKNPVMREDLYNKMMKLDPDEATEEEREAGAITKLRYMQFREKSSSSSSLGFRPEAVRISGQEPNTDLKKIKTRDDVKATICSYIKDNGSVVGRLLSRLEQIRENIEKSEFFKKHEIIGSSLLFLYDADGHANVWMIDFAKTIPVDGLTLNHRRAWSLGNHEDGYLFGLDNLIEVFEELKLENQKIEDVTSHTSTEQHS